LISTLLRFFWWLTRAERYKWLLSWAPAWWYAG
jgi:hypothetical protein